MPLDDQDKQWIRATLAEIVGGQPKTAVGPASQAEPIPRPIQTHGCANFWYDHGCPDRIGAEIKVAMTSGKTAVFRLSKIEPATGVDWSWYDFDFVRYLPSPNTKLTDPKGSV